ncbi:MAG: HD domain-containing protein [Bacteroidetes bacterium]|nr:HD domain-containing protein [Bacteroidota bacterium]
MNEEIINKAHQYVQKLFNEHAPPENVYHNLSHTTEVVSAVKEIAAAEGVGDDDLELLLIAAWFHDSGYVKTCEGHEDVSVGYVKEFLQSINYPEDKIKKIESLIAITKMPQSPNNHLEEILCDADLHHIGLKGFEEKGDLLRLEREKRDDKVCTDQEWLEISLEFLNQHPFYTSYAKEKFGIQKNINFIKIEKQLKKLKKKNKDSRLRETKLELDKQKVETKKKLEKEGGRGVETMFRNIMRTHVSFSSMADNKANIMITVNTLVLTIIVSIMVRKLDTNPQLIIPTALLTVTSLVALIYAILVTRPKVTSGTFTKDDIHNKKANLLFFGNFYNMDLGDFSWGMKEMMNNKEYLYDTMIEDFYFLGQVLGKKYKQLRYCYTFFMYGIIISIIAFAIAFIMYPQGMDIGPIIE